MVAPMPGTVQHTEETEMYPVGTEVIYKGQRGTVSFCDPATGTCSICVRVFKDDPARNVCLVCLLYTSPSPRDLSTSRMPSSA